jgi:outer membrane protein
MINGMRLSIFSLIVAAFIAMPAFSGASDANAQAQGLRVGFTDHEIIIVNMPEYQRVQNQLQGLFRDGQQEMAEMYQQYQESLERYQRQQALLNEQRRAEREQELMQLQQQIQQAGQEKEQQIAQREAELMQPLFERVQSAIDNVASRRNLDIVLRANVGNQPMILYVNPNTITDITLDVARELGIEVDEAAVAN